MVEWERKPTDPDRIVKEVDLPEGHAVLVADAPDYVNLPDGLREQYPDLPKRANVVEVKFLTWQGQIRMHYKLDVKVNNKVLYVAKADQFYWHTRD
jgi:hypothetical protein